MTVAIGDIGHLLAERRKSLKLTQADVAQRLGSSQSYIAQIEGGARRGIRWPTIVEFARALDLEPILVPRDRLSEIEALLRTKPDDEMPPLVGEAWSDDE